MESNSPIEVVLAVKSCLNCSHHGLTAYPFDMNFENLDKMTRSYKDGIYYLESHNEGEQYRVAVPIHGNMCTSTWVAGMVSKGYPVVSELRSVSSVVDCMELEFNDEYVYLLDELDEFWSNVSRQTRKTYNRIYKEHTRHMKSVNEITDQDIEEMHHVTHEWFYNLRGADDKYFWSKDDIYKYLKTEPTQGNLLFHRDSLGDMVAWDYYEIHDNTAVLVAGHSAIPGSFKYITFSLLNIAHKIHKCKYANIGRTAIFKGKHILTNKYNVTPTSVAKAKSYFPHIVQYTMYSVPEGVEVKKPEVSSLF